MSTELWDPACFLPLAGEVDEAKILEQQYSSGDKVQCALLFCRTEVKK